MVSAVKSFETANLITRQLRGVLFYLLVYICYSYNAKNNILLFDGRISISERVPKHIHPAEVFARDEIPIRLGVLRRRRRVAVRRPADGPAGLGDPDGLPFGRDDGVVVQVLEDGLGALDAVVLVLFVVGVEVHAEEVHIVDHGGVGAVGPRAPRVDVPDGRAGQRRARQRAPHLLDELHDGGGPGAHACLVRDAARGEPVEVFAADAEPDDGVGEARAELVDGGLQRLDLVVDGGRPRTPDAEEERGVGVDGGLEGLDGRVGGSGLDVGVQARAVEDAGREV